MVARVPLRGEGWPDERLATALNLKPGTPLELGQMRPLTGPVLTLEPDRGMNFFALAPRLLINPTARLYQAGLRQVSQVDQQARRQGKNIHPAIRFQRQHRSRQRAHLA